MHRNSVIVDSNAGLGIWDRAVELVVTGRLRLAPLISAAYPLEAALDVARAHRDGAIKVVLAHRQPHAAGTWALHYTWHDPGTRSPSATGAGGAGIAIIGRGKE